MLKHTSRIPVKAGIEVDFVPSKMDELMKTINRFDFDYLIGSVHHIGDWLIDSETQIHRWKNQNIDNVYQQYFALVQEMVKTRQFDIIGHIDLPKKFGFRPRNNITSLLLETAQVMSKTDICVEINTSGLRKPCHEIYPSQDLLKTCFDHGLPVTLGSDAHSSEDVGADFDHAIRLLRQVGYTETVKFDRRDKQFVEL
jgi:histidinol-phosphatase (PHP family)